MNVRLRYIQNMSKIISSRKNKEKNALLRIIMIEDYKNIMLQNAENITKR